MTPLLPSSLARAMRLADRAARPTALSVQPAPPPRERTHRGTCDGCGRDAEVAPLAEVELCVACLRFAMWLDEDVRAEAAEFYEGLTR